MTRALFIHSTGTGPFMWDSVPDEVVPEALRVMPSNLGYPPFAPVPVTLVMTERSPAEAHEMVRGLARRAPHAKVVQLAGTGHMAPLTHGPKVHAALAEHLASRG